MDVHLHFLTFWNPCKEANLVICNQQTSRGLNYNRGIYNQTLNVSKFWSILSEEDRDFIQAVQDSIDEGWVWTRK